MKFTKKIKIWFLQILEVNRLNKSYTKVKDKSIVNTTKIPLTFDASINPKVSIIVPFYNKEIYTWNCLLHLNKQLKTTIPFEILLIDDNSTENCDFSLIKGISVHKNATHLGFLKSINAGIMLAKGEYIYLLSNNTEVQKDFLQELFFVFENFKNVGAVGSKLVSSNNTLKESGSLILTNYTFKDIAKGKEIFYPDVNFIAKVDYCSISSLLFKKQDDKGDLQLFDEQFDYSNFKEIDFCCELRYYHKKEIYYTPFSKVIQYNEDNYNILKKTKNPAITKKKELYSNVVEKFKQKWLKEIEAIHTNTIQDRIQEKYNNKSVVIFCEKIPQYDKDSGGNRLKEIITAFTELDFQVTLIAKNTYIDNTYITLYQRLGVNVFYEYKKFKSTDEYLNEQKLNASIAWFYFPKVFIDNYKLAKKYLPNAKLVYDMVDIHHLRYKRAIEFQPSRISLRSKYIKYKKIEILASKLADMVVTISDFEEQYMKSICEENKIITISNIHYTKTDLSNTLTFEDRKDILFIGSSHTPNIDALYYLFNDIMPLVWTKFPTIKVNVIGNLDKVITDINHPNFIFLGYIENIEQAFISNKFMIAPLRYGAGVKGKIGQAFEYYLPVITSSIGAEGMKLVNRKNALIEDSKDGFANAIIKLYTDKELWNTLQTNSEDSLKPFSKENLKEQIIKIQQHKILKN